MNGSSARRSGTRRPTASTAVPGHDHRRLERLAWLLDSALPVPVLGRVGLDGLLGLVPGVGDLLTALLSGYIFIEGARMRVPKTVLLRMGLNVAVDTVLGAIPVVGDLFDIAWRSNRRNVRLLQQYATGPRRVSTGSRVVLWLIVLLLLVLLGLMAWGVLLLLGALWGALFG